MNAVLPAQFFSDHLDNGVDCTEQKPIEYRPHNPGSSQVKSHQCYQFYVSAAKLPAAQKIRNQKNSAHENTAHSG